MRRIAYIIIALAPLVASAITATKEYVDRKDGENAVAATNLVVAATNAIASTVVTALGETSTNTVVYSSTPLLIRSQTDSDGVKRYRLIDLTP